MKIQVETYRPTFNTCVYKTQVYICIYKSARLCIYIYIQIHIDVQICVH